jgi:signal transduction histidine kinase/ligand-binding sensor domain-containing protein
MVGLALFSGGFASAAHAAATNFVIDTWDAQQGLPDSTVTSIAQTPDGYLWVGTYGGLARFDGTHFEAFDFLNHARIQDLYVDVSGTLWINTFRGGLCSVKDGSIRRELPDQALFDLHNMLAYSTSNRVVFASQFGTVFSHALTDTNTDWESLAPPGDSRPVFQCVDARGIVWFLSRGGTILRLVGKEFKPLPDDGGLGGKAVLTLVADHAGNIWAGAENEIARWNGNRFQVMTPTNGEPTLTPLVMLPTRQGAIWVLDGDRMRKMVGREWVDEATEWRGLLGTASGRAMGAHEDHAGGIWFNTYGNGVFYIAPDGKRQRLTMQDGLRSDRVGAWLEGHDGGIWLGLDRGGLARLHPPKPRFQTVGMAEGLTAWAASTVCEDADGMIWIGTAGGGLCGWDGQRITSYVVGNNLAANFVFSVFPQPNGGLWLSAEGEDLLDFRDGHIGKAAWDVHGIKSILSDKEGRLWLGTKAGVSCWTDAGRQELEGTNSVSLPAVRALAEGTNDSVWCGADDGTLYHCEAAKLEGFRPNDALAEKSIRALLAEPDGTVWAGTYGGGLLRFKNGKFTRYARREGLPADIVSQILEDERGRLWLGTQQGIIRVDKAELEAVAAHSRSRVDCASYGPSDGLPAAECSESYQPACWRARDGRLWFTTTAGAVSVNPADLRDNPVPPPVFVEELRVDDETEALTKSVVIEPGHNQIEFRFAALNFDAGDKTRFRYRIEGLDTDWVETDSSRPTAEYWHLPANHYVFRVTACNGDGIWNPTGASISFQIKPHWYEAGWFLILTAVSALAGVGAGARVASARKYRRELSKIEQQHAIERDRARIAKDIHDDIGAGLTQITLLSELARREPQNSSSHLDRISQSARELTRAMDEIVWAVDPQHDTFSGFMDYASAYAEDFLRTAGIRCRMDVPGALPDVRVDTELRYNLFLALKEALNNIVKHSNATEVWLRLMEEPEGWTLVVEDNGQGLTPNGQNPSARNDRLTSGSGLLNLENRLAVVGGRCVVNSSPGRGTRVEMRLPALPQPEAGPVDNSSPIVAIGESSNED